METSLTTVVGCDAPSDDTNPTARGGRGDRADPRCPLAEGQGRGPRRRRSV